MNTFGVVCAIGGICCWLLVAYFIADDSPLQKYRLRKALDRLICELGHMVDKGVRHPEFNIIYKNRKFAIGIIYKEVNYHYGTYTIFINGEEAGVYHKLRHNCNNSYYFEAINHRHTNEVISIIFAANKAIKQSLKNKKEKKDGYTEYSYFK